MEQSATLKFTDGVYGQLHITMVFDPEINDETISTAVECAIQCLEHVNKHFTRTEAG